MNAMHNFSRALSQYMAESRRTQNDLAENSGVPRSKICRLMANKISCDRGDLDGFLNAIPDENARHALVMAYLRDVASPGALLHVRKDAQGQWQGFDFSPLTPKGRTALQALLTSRNVRSFEKVILGLAEAMTA